MCQDTSEPKKIQSLLSSDVPRHKWTEKNSKSFKFRCAKTQVDQEKIFKVQSQVHK